MKTINQVIKENSMYRILINNVVKQIGGGKDAIETLSQLRSADDGYCGFTYYRDTCEFFNKNRKLILDMISNQFDDFGYKDEIEMISNFGVFRNSQIDADDRKDLYKFLAGQKLQQGTISNVLAWYALEEVARFFQD